MFREPYLSECVQYITLNVISAFLCAATHNALYFMLGLTNWAFHFMHYLFTFMMLFLSYWCGLIPKKALPFRDIFPLTVTQVIVSVTTCVIHSGGKDGALYTLRLTDFAVTILAIYLAPKFLDSTCLPSDKTRAVLIFVAVSSSLAWLEFGILEYDFVALLMTPILAVASALHCLLTFQKQQKLQVHTDLLTMYITGSVAACLFIPAVIFTSDSFNKEMLGTASSWEVIDYALLSMAVVFMIGLIYSKYWMMANLSPETYLIFRHAKYTVASLGQWFTQNMAHATLFSAVGKAMASAGLSYYGWRRWVEYRNNQKFSALTNGVGKI